MPDTNDFSEWPVIDFEKHPELPGPAFVRVLLVADDEVTFDKSERFSLNELVKALEAPSLLTKFGVTKVHRNSDSWKWSAGASITGFRFSNPDHFNPEDFDQVWLISSTIPGYSSAGTNPDLTDVELRILTEFMDAGGGVFATGDHEDLGSNLCGRVPRVRSMRDWTFYDGLSNPAAYDPASGHSPPVEGRWRHDTLVPGHDAVTTFDDQSDDVPARIEPVRYRTSQTGSLRWVHPLMCTPAGPIGWLPDHMHEGRCKVPEDLDQTVTFDGATFREYPIVDGHQESPVIVAYGTIVPHETYNPDFVSIGNNGLDPMTVVTRFPCTSAYDGHAVGVGRVVTDSTFHHFVDINITGTGSKSSDPIKQTGFYTPSGKAALAQIRAYWRNIATWLTPRPVSQMFFPKALVHARRDEELALRRPPRFTTDRGPVNFWDDAVRYGLLTQHALVTMFGACFVHEWVSIAWVNPLSKYKWWLKLTLPDPPPWEKLAIGPEEIMAGLLGHAMSGLVHQTNGATSGAEAERLAVRAIRTGFREATAAAQEAVVARAEATREMLGQAIR